jgi:hypothetical protein
MITDNEIEKALKQHLREEGKKLPLYMLEDEKYEKEIKECAENMTEISQECKDYLKRKFEEDFDEIHQPDTYMDTYMGPANKYNWRKPAK